MTFIIWATPTYHNRYATWLQEVQNKPKVLERQSKTSLSLEDAKHGVRNVACWKVAEPDRVHEIW